MALHHAATGELIDVRPLADDALRWARSRVLFKTDHVEVSRIALKDGDRIPPHEAPGETTIHVLDGAIEVAIGGRKQWMQPGELVCMVRGETFTVRATAPCSFLLTMLLHAVE